MARIDVHGGDFAKGIGAFHARGGFVLRDSDGEVDTIPLSRLEAADHASEISLQIFGAGEALRMDFERATKSVAAGHRLFIAVFADGRLLLASADQAAFEQICGARRV
jgi:hypothetical protein